MSESIDKIENIIGIKFKNPQLLHQSRIHKSLLNENPKLDSNERLEFLGDSVIQTSVSILLYSKHADWPEGTLSQARSKLVNGENLAKLSIKLGLGKYLLVSKGEEENGGREKQSNLADLFEAVVGAIFLDQGFQKAQLFINSFMIPLDIENPTTDYLLDPKSILQIKIQKYNKPSETGKLLKYHTISVSGKSPKQLFTVEVKMDNKVLGKGHGSKKSEAEQNAASDALKSIVY